MRKFLIVIIVFVFGITSLKTEEKEYDWPVNRIGASASSFTGYGLTYFRHFADDFVIKLAVFGYGESNDDSNYQNSSLFGTIGTELQYNLHKTKYTRLHLFGAFSIWYDESIYGYGLSYYSSSIKREYVTGFGFGFEFLAWGIISFNIETGLMGRFGANTYSDYSMTTTTDPKYYGFGIGGGITYAF